MGVQCSLDGLRGGAAQQGWLLRPVCAHQADVELYVPSADARLLFWRINGNFSLDGGQSPLC